MKNRLFFCFFLLFSLAASAQKERDTLFLNNGSMIVGELDFIKLGVAQFDPDDANDVSVQVRKIKSIDGGRRAYRIETINHITLYGKIAPSGLDGIITVYNQFDSTQILLLNIYRLLPVEEKWLKKIDGSFSLGYSYTKSSELGRLNSDLSMRYLSRTTEHNITGSLIYSIEDTAWMRDREDLSYRFNWYFGNTWFSQLGITYQRNQELGIDRRYQQALGIGNRLVMKQRMRLFAIASMVVNQEQSVEVTTPDNLYEASLRIQFDVYKFEKPKTTIALSQTAYYGLTQPGRIRDEGSTDISIELYKDFYLKLNFYVSYDSEPPASPDAKVDYGTVIGISVLF